jgi:hypothetical protein
MTNNVYDLAVNKDQLFVPDFRNNKLIVFELPGGNILSKFDVSMPHGIAVDLNGKIYICTYKQNSIVVIEDDISMCKDNIHFNHPVSIAIQDNYTLIANWGEGDSGNLIVSSDLHYWLNYVNMKEDEFWKIADTFRDPNVWWIKENKWWKDNIWGGVFIIW